MNTDIRVAISFRGHRKRKRLAIMLGPEGVLALLDLWIGVAASRPDGTLSGWDEIDIALEAGWDGDPQEFVDALLKVGFLDRDEDGVYSLHDWLDHNHL
ncbi:MAG TPA: hypothetical protein ENK29_04070 [Chromatiales bacterium]|nr:hypothetical protein [Chromatiales bacterium]